MPHRRLYTALALAGTLPFAACALVDLSGASLPWLTVAPHDIVNAYGLGILSFLAGSHWGTYLYRSSESPINLMIASNLLFLAAWFAFVFAGPPVASATQIAVFVALLAVDDRLRRSGLIDGHYFRIRLTATLVAVLSLGVFL
jgi:hypothetical protein